MNSPIKIAVIFEYASLNGGERSMLAVMDRLGRESFQFTALAPKIGPLADTLRDRSIGHLPFSLHDDEGRRLSREETCANLLKNIGVVSPDLVHANSLSMGRLTGAVAAESAPPTIAHLRDIIKLSGATIADLNRNRSLIAVSQATKAFHVKQGLNDEQTRVLYNGVDCKQFLPTPASGELRRELDLPDDAFLVVTIGQIGLRKAQDVLAEAAVIAKDRLPNVYYLLVGERNSAKQESIEFERNLLRRFEQAGLADRLHPVGYRTDVARIMNEADLLVHPAHQEPLGRVLLEAAAAGLPIIATKVGGTPEILQNSESARLIPPGNASALAEAMVELVADRAMRDVFAASARQRIENQFSIDIAAENLAAVWEESAG